MKQAFEWRKGIENITPYQPGKPIAEVERESGIKNIVKLASNENSYGPSPLVKKRLKQAVAGLGVYPDGSCHELRQQLAKKLNCQSNELIIGNGSNELLILLGMAVLNKGDHVLTSQMSFVVYPKVAQLMQAHLTTVPMKDYTYDLDKMAQAITTQTRLIFIANPNNPTGTMVDSASLIRFIKKVPSTCLIVLDEAYYEYVDPNLRTPSLEWARHYPNVVVLRTFSKAYGLAGIRIGYAVVSPSVYQAIERVREPFNANALSQVAAVAALQDHAYMKKCVAILKKERPRVGRQLFQLGMTVIPSQTNFLFVDLSSLKGSYQWTGDVFFEALLKKGVIIRPMPGSYARITLGKPGENNKMLRAVKSLIKA